MRAGYPLAKGESDRSVYFCSTLRMTLKPAKLNLGQVLSS
jgi:hypothetical protein